MTVIVLVAIACTGLLVWLLRWAIHRGLAPERVPEQRTPAELGLPFREVRIATANGKSLFGWFVPAEGKGPKPAVAIVHGWGGNSEMMLPLAQPLREAGISSLFFDARCHGASDEDSFTSLPRFAEDAEYALDWLGTQPEIDARRMAVFGHSVGAGAVLLAASRRTDIAAVVSLAAFSHPVTMMRRWFDTKRIPYYPLGWLILRYIEWIIGYRFDAIAPLTTMGKVRCPTLLIHGAADETVPPSEAEAIYAARSGGHVQLRVIAGSHDDFSDLEREIPALVSFLERELRPSLQ